MVSTGVAAPLRPKATNCQLVFSRPVLTAVGAVLCPVASGVTPGVLGMTVPGVAEVGSVGITQEAKIKSASRKARL